MKKLLRLETVLVALIIGFAVPTEIGSIIAVVGAYVSLLTKQILDYRSSIHTEDTAKLVKQLKEEMASLKNSITINRM